MGPGEGATESNKKNAEKLGSLIAENGWILLTGGRNTGVMEAANRGAKKSNGLTIGILPSDEEEKISKFVDVPIITNMRSARNYINVISSKVVIACGMDHGTASEVSLAMVADKQIILLDCDKETEIFFNKIGKVITTKVPEEAVSIIKRILAK